MALRRYSSIRSFKPDIVLMDIVMPVMDGVEATGLILQNDPGARIVVITSLSSSDLSLGDASVKVLDALRLGAKGVLTKPLEADNIRSALEVI